MSIDDESNFNRRVGMTREREKSKSNWLSVQKAAVMANVTELIIYKWADIRGLRYMVKNGRCYICQHSLFDFIEHENNSFISVTPSRMATERTDNQIDINVAIVSFVVLFSLDAIGNLALKRELK